MVGDVQIVVHGLGDADDPQVQPLPLCQLVDLVAGVHGVVAAVVKEAVNIEFLQRLQHRGVVLIGELSPAGADGGGGGMAQFGNGLRAHIRQVDEIPLEDALRPEPGGIDLIYFAGSPRGLRSEERRVGKECRL